MEDEQAPIEELAPLDDALLDALGCAVWLYDGERLVHVNKAVEEFTGYSREQLVEPGFFRQLLHPDYAGEFLEVFRRRLSNRQVPRQYEMPIFDREGKLRWLTLSVRMVRYDGRPMVLVAALDITERRLLHEQREDRLRAFERLAEHLPVGTWSMSPRGRILYLNRTMLEYYGLSLPEALRRDRDEPGWQIPPDEREGALGELRTKLAAGLPFEMEARFRRWDGQHRWHLFRAVPVHDDDGVAGWIAAGTDIHSRKLVEEALSQQESQLAEALALLETLVDRAPVGFAFLDTELRYRHVNQSLAALNGIPVEDHLGKPITDLLPPLGDEVAGIIRRVIETGEPAQDVDIRIETPAEPGVERYFLAGFYPVRIDRKVAGVGAVVVEVTERQRVQQALERTNTLKDEFLGLVSHELRTPLTSILGNAQVLLRRPDLDPESRARALTDVRDEAQRLQQLVENMLLIAGIQTQAETELEPVLLHRLVPHTVDAYRKHHPEPEILVEAEPDVPAVEGDPTYVEQVVTNFLSNAFKYGGNSPIEVRVERGDNEVLVRVLDRGPGLSREDLESVFQPFYRSSHTAHLKSGAGLGLAVCMRLVEAQHGRIWARNRDDGGAEFGFALEVEPEER